MDSERTEEMTDSTYTDITIVADRSGSMNGAADGGYSKAQRSTDGVKNLVAEQKAEPGKVRFSLLDFDNTFSWVARGAETLDWTCQPRHMTALLDAVGQAITDTGSRLAAMPEDERPGRVMFVIATDGMENASREFTLEQLKAMVTEQKEKYGWEFMFIGADIDAFGEGMKMGYDADSTIAVAASGYSVGWNVTSDAVKTARAGGTKVAYTPAQRQQVKDAEDK